MVLELYRRLVPVTVVGSLRWVRLAYPILLSRLLSHRASASVLARFREVRHVFVATTVLTPK
jgi:hypothetical protein